MNKNSLARLAGIVKANVNEVLDRFEDPEKMVRQYGRDLEDAVEDTATALARATVGVRRLERQIEQARDQVRIAGERAEAAVRGGDEATARTALEAKAAGEQRLAGTEDALAEGRGTVDELRRELTQLRQRLQEVRDREAALAGRFRAVKARQGVEPAVAATDVERARHRGATAIREWERANEKVEAAEAEAEIYREMAPPAPVAPSPDIEAELTALRRKIKDN